MKRGEKERGMAIYMILNETNRKNVLGWKNKKIFTS
jgi:hypothetical protein